MRRRLYYMALAGTTMCLGLASRSLGLPPENFVVRHFGDVLWAGLVYFLIRTASPQSLLRHSALLAIVFSFTIEFLQLCQAPWLLGLRSHKLAALVLGHTFVFSDLLCYTSGIATALWIDTKMPRSLSTARH